MRINDSAMIKMSQIQTGLCLDSPDDQKLEVSKNKLARGDRDFTNRKFTIYKSTSELNQSLSKRLKANNHLSCEID